MSQTPDDPSLIGTAPAQDVYSPEQLTARRASSRRRAVAMVSEYDEILGFTVRALSPATHSRLVVIDSPFLYRVAGGASDVRDYLWFHWPAFDAQGLGRDAFQRALEARINPPWRGWRTSRAARHDIVAAAYARASIQIQELCTIAFADDGPGGEGGKRVSAALEAQLIDIFAERYRWEPDRTRHTPLRQLYQLLNCINGSDFDRSEVDVIAEELRQANADVIASRHAAKQPI